MSQIIIKVKCPIHLIRFYETLCGGQPIVFNKRIKRYFNRFLNHYLEFPPLGFKEIEDGDDVMKIELPFFEDKDVRSHYYLPPEREKLFVKILDRYFRLTFYNEAFTVMDFIDGQFQMKKIILDNFIETYNLPVDSIDFLQRDYNRLLYIRRKRLLFRKNKNTPVFGGEI